MFKPSDSEDISGEILVGQNDSQDHDTAIAQESDADESGSTYRDESRRISELFALSRMGC